MRLKPRSVFVLLALAALSVAPALSQTYNVTVTNLTQDQIFSPPLAVIHTGDLALFQAGSPASPELAELAEDGSPNGLVAHLSGLSGVFDTAVSGGPVMPGATVTFQVDGRAPFNKISVVGMLISTNDAFFAVNGASRPAGFRSAVVNALAYDAGSEANTESCDHIPGPPCGNGGVRVETGAEGYVYVSSGVQGVLDLPASKDWRNPVARVSIQRVRQ